MTVGWVTLDVGEQALVYDHHGSARIEDGPKRMFLFRERLTMLTRYSANQNEYLVVKHRDGRIEHMQGPCVMFLNTIAYQSIRKKDMIPLDANEALVVYKQDTKSNEVKRYIKYGPTLFMPMANEWLHSFSWHGTDPSNKTRLIPNSKHFERLQVIPDQFYYNVDEVRTADDALIRVKLMMFYELKDIELLLETSKDPIADFINCLCADTVSFAGKYTYIEFMEHSSELNNLSSFPQLTERAKSIGYNISKYESEEQDQRMTDLKLKNEKDRIDMEQKIEVEELTHRHSMEKSKIEHKLEMEKRSEEDKRRKWEVERKGELQATNLQDQQKLDYFNNLHGLGVDLNQYIQSLSPRPEKITRIVAPDNSTSLHLHHS